MEKYRIENIKKVRMGGKKVKLFKAYEYDSKQNAYIFCGQFDAPEKMANKNLINFIN